MLKRNLLLHEREQPITESHITETAITWCSCKKGHSYNIGLSYNGMSYNIGLSYNGPSYNGLSHNGPSYNGLCYNGLNYNGVVQEQHH